MQTRYITDEKALLAHYQFMMTFFISCDDKNMDESF